MSRSDEQHNFEIVYGGLVEKLGTADYENAISNLGAREAGSGVAVDILGRTCLIGPDGIRLADGGRLSVEVRIVLAWYILHGGSGELSEKWTLYRDLKEGQVFYAAFNQLVQEKIAQDFAGRMNRLKQATDILCGASISDELNGDLAYRFMALPKVPLALVFYDADEEFSANARVLYPNVA